MSVIVSLTTIASRLDVCRQTCLTLASQDSPPDRIVLHVSSAPYLLDSGIPDSTSMRWAEGIPGLHIEWVENAGPYRKLLPALLQARTGDIVVTADDDVLYGPGWLGSLVIAAERQPDAVVCGRARRPSSLLGRYRGYWAWPFASTGSIAKGLVPVGTAGVAYRPELLDLDWLVDSHQKDVAATTDDLWFAEAARRKGTPILVAPGTESHISPIPHHVTLFDINGGSRQARSSFARRMFRRLKSQLGISCCVNDVNFKLIRAYSLALGTTDRASSIHARN